MSLYGGENYCYVSEALQPGGVGYDIGFDPVPRSMIHEKEQEDISSEWDEAIREIFREMDLRLKKEGWYK